VLGGVSTVLLTGSVAGGLLLLVADDNAKDMLAAAAAAALANEADDIPPVLVEGCGCPMIESYSREDSRCDLVLSLL